MSCIRVALVLLLIAFCRADTILNIGPVDHFAGLATGWSDLSSFGGAGLGISTDLLRHLAQLAKSVFSMSIDTISSNMMPYGDGMHKLMRPGGVLAPTALTVGLAMEKPSPNDVSQHALPPLPALPKGHKLAPWASKHQMFLQLLTEKWTGALVRAQFKPGMQGFLGLLHLQDEQEALIRWICIIYPWETHVPDLLRDMRESYCAKALPAAALSSLFGSGPPKLLSLPGPVAILG